jgi:hypothetical protein
MPRLRISLWIMLAAVALAALGLAGMASPSRLALAVAATVTLAVLLAAILAAWLGPRIDRAFWVGFAVFGWTYLVLTNLDWVGGRFGHDLTAGLDDLVDMLVTHAPNPAPSGVRSPELLRDRQMRAGNVIEIGRMLLALAFAVAGALVGTVLARRREPRGKSSGAAPPD